LIATDPCRKVAGIDSDAIAELRGSQLAPLDRPANRQVLEANRFGRLSHGQELADDHTSIVKMISRDRSHTSRNLRRAR
jgi:hypothetical protein